MKSEEIIEGIDRILEEWDPGGVLQKFKPITYVKGAIGDYSEFVKPIIITYLSHQSIYDHLVGIHVYIMGIDVNEEGWEKAKSYTLKASESIFTFLSKYSIDELKEASLFSLKKL